MGGLTETPMPVAKRAGIAAAMAACCTLAYWATCDIWRGEWREIPARVTGRHFVPDRSHWTTVVYNCGTADRPQTCTRQRYVNIPAEYHVFTVEPDGRHGDFNDAWAFSNLNAGDHCIITARVGRSGWRWLQTIKHEKRS